MQDISKFLEELQTAINKYFPNSSIHYILRTSKSLKLNIILKKGIVVAVRYNSRNNRSDFALIENDRRIFGYDNLKNWHYHPFDDPEIHIECEEPSLEKIFTEIERYFAKISETF